MNKPYVKVYEEADGVQELKNPIIGAYRTEGLNRKARRKKPERMNNRKGAKFVLANVSATEIVKFKLKPQYIKKGKSTKTIYHYE